eukprot:scaffold372989_cov63-Cyclotella_meneghiniana.AAC.1
MAQGVPKPASYVEYPSRREPISNIMQCSLLKEVSLSFQKGHTVLRHLYSNLVGLVLGWMVNVEFAM